MREVSFTHWNKSSAGLRAMSTAIKYVALLKLLLACLPASGNPPEIHVISSDKSELYESFSATLVSELQAGGSGFAIHNTSIDGMPPSDTTIRASSNLVITVGSHAARSIADLNIQTPVVHTLLPMSVYRDISPLHQDCRRKTALFIDQPLARQARLARLMFPESREYGILLGPISVNRLNEINTIGDFNGIEFKTGIASENDNKLAAGRKLINESELIIAVNDPVALNPKTAKWILYVAYQQRKPVIGFSEAYVRAGAAAAVYSSPEQIARDTANMASSWLASSRRCLPAPGFPKDFSVSVNRAVSESLGSALTSEEELHRQIVNGEQP